MRLLSIPRVATLAALLFISLTQGASSQDTSSEKFRLEVESRAGFNSLDQATRTEIQNYANTMYQAAGGIGALTETDMGGLIELNGISVWEAVGNVMLVDKVANRLVNEDYQGVVEIIAEYSARKIVLKSTILRRLNGATAIGELAALPITLQLSGFARHMEHSGLQCQLALYDRARRAPYSFSHRRIMAARGSAQELVYFHNSSGYFTNVGQEGCGNFGADNINPPAQYDRDELFDFFNVIVAAKEQITRNSSAEIMLGEYLKVTFYDQMQTLLDMTWIGTWEGNYTCNDQGILIGSVVWNISQLSDGNLSVHEVTKRNGTEVVVYLVSEDGITFSGRSEKYQIEATMTSPSDATGSWPGYAPCSNISVTRSH